MFWSKSTLQHVLLRERKMLRGWDTYVLMRGCVVDTRVCLLPPFWVFFFLLLSYPTHILDISLTAECCSLHWIILAFSVSVQHIRKNISGSQSQPVGVSPYVCDQGWPCPQAFIEILIHLCGFLNVFIKSASSEGSAETWYCPSTVHQCEIQSFQPGGSPQEKAFSNAFSSAQGPTTHLQNTL